MYVLSHSVLSDSVTPWTVTCQGSSVQNTGMGGHPLLWGILTSVGDVGQCLKTVWVITTREEEMLASSGKRSVVVQSLSRV